METDVEKKEDFTNSIMEWSQNNGNAESVADEQSAEIHADEKSAEGDAILKSAKIATEEKSPGVDADEKSAVLPNEQNSVEENTDKKSSNLNAGKLLIENETKIAAKPLVIHAISGSFFNQSFEPTVNGKEDIHSNDCTELTNIDNESQNLPISKEKSGNQESETNNENDNISIEQLESETNQMNGENMKKEIIEDKADDDNDKVEAIVSESNVLNEIKEEEDKTDDGNEKVDAITTEASVKMESEGRTLKTESAGGMSMMIIWAKDDDQEEATDSEQEDDNSSDIDQDNDNKSDNEQDNDNINDNNEDNYNNSDNDEDNYNNSDNDQDNDDNSGLDDQVKTNDSHEDQDDQCEDGESLSVTEKEDTETQENNDVEMPTVKIKKELCADDNSAKDSLSQIRIEETFTENKEITTMDQAFRKYCQEIDGVPHCSDCNVGFKDIPEIIDHMKSHITEDKTTSSNPNQEYNSSDTAIENKDESLTMKIKTEKQDTSSCKEIFVNEEERRLSVADILEKLYKDDSLDDESWKRLYYQRSGLYKCFLCFKGLKNPPSIKSHIKLLHCKARMKCDVCEKSFRYKNHLIAHTEETHPQLLFRCTLCPKERGLNRLYLEQDILDKHKESHAEASRKSRREKRLQHSTLAERSFRKHKCYMCDKSFNKSVFLRAHLEKAHGILQDENDVYEDQEYVNLFTTEDYGNNDATEDYSNDHTEDYGNDHITEDYSNDHTTEDYNNDHTEDNYYDEEGQSQEPQTVDYPSIDPSSLVIVKQENTDQDSQDVGRYDTLEDNNGRVLFCCKFCSRQFESKTGLNNHMRGHKGSEIPRRTTEKLPKSENCSFCSEAFSNTAQLHAHIKFAHSNQLYKCTVCSRKFATHAQLRSHELVIHEWGYGAVSVTKKTETGEEALEQDDDKSDDYTPSPYQKKKKKKEDISLSVANGITMFNCNLCNKQFGTKDYTLAHIKVVHGGEKPHPCNECDASFVYNYQLLEHKEISHGLKLFRCDMCPKGFLEEGVLEKHKTVHLHQEKGQQRNLPCPICPKMFMRSEHVRWHLKYCKKKNGDGKSDVNKVIGEVNETSIKAESVTPAPSGAGNPSNISAAKPAKIYPAVIPKSDLPKNLNNLFTMNKNINGEQVYKCKVCDKRFHTNANIRNHTMIHTGEKPHSCDICNEGFQYSYQVLLHKQEIHGIKIYRCKQCRKRFQEEDEFKQHVRDHREKEQLDQIRYSAKKRKKDFQMHCPVIKYSPITKYSPSPKEAKPYTCIICEQNFSSKHNANTHIQYKHKSGDEDLFKEALSALDQTEERISKENDINKPYSCPICNKRFMHKYYIRAHIKTLHKTLDEESIENALGAVDKLVPQYPGEEETLSSINLGGSNPLDRPYSCPVCDQRYSTKDYAKTHIVVAHKTLDEASKQIALQTVEQTVPEVAKVVNNEGNRNVQKVVEKIKPELKNIQQSKLLTGNNEIFTCSFCAKRFASREFLHTHITTAHSKKGVINITSNGLIISKVNESGGYIHTGGTGASSVASRKVLKAPSVFHQSAKVDKQNGKRVFSCLLCGKTFLSQDSVSLHMKGIHGHTDKGGKPYACPVCNKRFLTRDYIRKHINSQHPWHLGKDANGSDIDFDNSNKKYPCPVCKKKFKTQHYINKHIETVHKGVNPAYYPGGTPGPSGQAVRIKNEVSDYGQIQDDSNTWSSYNSNEDQIHVPIKSEQGTYDDIAADTTEYTDNYEMENGEEESYMNEDGQYDYDNDGVAEEYDEEMVDATGEDNYNDYDDYQDENAELTDAFIPQAGEGEGATAQEDWNLQIASVSHVTEGEFESVYGEGVEEGDYEGMEEGDYMEGDVYEEEDDGEVDPLMI